MALTVYLLSFDTRVTPQPDLRAQIDAMPEIVNWFSVMPASFLLVTELSASELRVLFRARSSLRHPKATFLFASISRATIAGAIPQLGWDFISQPGPPKTTT